MKVLIGGGSGFIGQHLRKSLVSRGHNVQIISRTAKPGGITWDKLRKDDTLPECDALVNLSGEYVLSMTRRWNDSYKNDVWNSRIETNKLLVQLMENGKHKPKVWVAGVAEGYYPRSLSASYDESFILQQPVGFMQKLCSEWEKSSIIQDETNIRHVGIRIGLVLGRNGGLIQQSYWPFYFGLGGVIGSGQQIMSWIHINDLANIFVHAIENDNVTGFINGTAPNPCTMTEFTKAYGSALNRSTIFPVPEFVIKFAVGEDRSPFMLEGARVLPKKTVETGYQYQFTDIKDCMKDIVGS